MSALAPILYGCFSWKEEDCTVGIGDCCGLIGLLFTLAWLIAGMFVDIVNYGVRRGLKTPGPVRW